MAAAELKNKPLAHKMPLSVLNDIALHLKLAALDAQIVKLALVDGLSRQAIGDKLGVSRQYVDRRVNRFLKLSGVSIKDGTAPLVIPGVPFDQHERARVLVPSVLRESVISTGLDITPAKAKTGTPAKPRRAPLDVKPSAETLLARVAGPIDPDSFNLPPAAVLANQRALEQRIAAAATLDPVDLDRIFGA